MYNTCNYVRVSASKTASWHLAKCAEMILDPFQNDVFHANANSSPCQLFFGCALKDLIGIFNLKSISPVKLLEQLKMVIQVITELKMVIQVITS